MKLTLSESNSKQIFFIHLTRSGLNFYPTQPIQNLIRTGFAQPTLVSNFNLFQT